MSILPQGEAMKVVVIGSCMIDLCCYASRLPRPGETLIGSKFILGYGGKGANQCVMAARLGATTALVARLGDDSFGEDYKAILTKNNINIDHVNVSNNCSSGMAQITVAENGENQIVIVPGANNMLSKADVLKASEFLDTAKVLVFQLETPIDTTIEILKLYHTKTKCIVNAAPAYPDPNPALYSCCYIFCVNETEAEVMSGMSVKSVGDAEKAIAKFLMKGCNTVIITLGANGAVFASKDSPTPVHVSAKEVQPVDTTGAGDAFIGALAYYLAYHTELSLEEVIRRSCEIASLSVLQHGTQSSFPRRSDLSDKLFA